MLTNVSATTSPCSSNYGRPASASCTNTTTTTAAPQPSSPSCWLATLPPFRRLALSSVALQLFVFLSFGLSVCSLCALSVRLSACLLASLPISAAQLLPLLHLTALLTTCGIKCRLRFQRGRIVSRAISAAQLRPSGSSFRLRRRSEKIVQIILWCIYNCHNNVDYHF